MLHIRKKNLTNIAPNTRPIIQREWVETGDPRCPLACVWFALGHGNAVQSASQDPCESERRWPALLPGEQAFLSMLNCIAA